MDFRKLKTAVQQKFLEMSNYPLFRVNVDKDELWETYLNSFPEGTNPLYRKRTQHDCSCCRQFIKSIGNIVAVDDSNNVISIWDVSVGNPGYGYQVVVDALAKFVKRHRIDNIFLHSEPYVGTDKNYEDQEGTIQTWEHFFVEIPRRNENSLLASKDTIGPKSSEARSTHDVFARGLSEIAPEAVDTVLELIDQNALYRGEEHKFAVIKFKELQEQWLRAHIFSRENAHAWRMSRSTPGSVTHIRSSAIGTLLVDLSEEKDLEVAIKAFETIVAPQNYRRPTAPVTKSMVEAAKAKVDELGLTSALDRRYANLSDITVNNILFVDRKSSPLLKQSVFDTILTRARSIKNLGSSTQVFSIEEFLSSIVPLATTIEVLFEGRQSGNLVSLIAPVDALSQSMFKWENRFSWSYTGDLADSIKERVKKAGGNIAGDLCCRLAWHNYDDLDLHMVEPGGREIYFHSKLSPRTGGMLDVDMNAGTGITREPVENIYYRSRGPLPNGAYHLFVHQYQARESFNTGFEAEIDFLGNIVSFSWDRPIPNGRTVTIARFRYSKEKNELEFIQSLPSTQISKTVWGINTNEFHTVNVIMMSPNYWDDQHGVGNKHYFFMMDACKNDGQARGFFNEYLKEDLNPHRKTLEIVGSKMKIAESADQLSGLGFSSTQHTEIVIRINSGKTIKVQI